MKPCLRGVGVRQHWSFQPIFLCLQGVTCIGYTDLPSRLPTQSSTLYSNNISKFLLSMGPFTTKVNDEFLIDHTDDAVRGALVAENGELMWPPPPLVVRPHPFAHLEPRVCGGSSHLMPYVAVYH